MTTTTDHYTEARMSIEGANGIGLSDFNDIALYHGALMEAQAHATLALVDAQREANEIARARVEQARIANLIALYNSGRTDSGGNQRTLADRLADKALDLAISGLELGL